jgi:hypothetical protein
MAIINVDTAHLEEYDNVEGMDAEYDMGEEDYVCKVGVTIPPQGSVLIDLQPLNPGQIVQGYEFNSSLMGPDGNVVLSAAATQPSVFTIEYEHCDGRNWEEQYDISAETAEFEEDGLTKMRIKHGESQFALAIYVWIRFA